MSREQITAQAPAKVNLTLRVGAPRADGLHPLDSLVVFADWGDTLTVTAGEGLTLDLVGPGAEALAVEPANLVLKAAFALRAAAGRPDLSARIVLDKELPIAAGLGGGSSDAAAALRALSDYWELDFSLRQLAEIGTVVGSDVPACVYARPLRMTGIGERIAPLVAWPELHGVVVNPGVALATGPVFAAYDTRGAQPLDHGALPAAGDLAGVLAIILPGRNDLEPAARSLAPEIDHVLQALARLDEVRLVRMSGSGASCFGLFDSREQADAAASTLAQQRPGWTVRAVSFRGAAA